LRRSQHFLDWANLPDPFRHYEGVPVLDLPADQASVDGPGFLSQLLFHSAAISASKVVPSSGYRYALRVNPSSGNLHPTEFHFFTRGLQDWPDGLYHYRPSSHMAEQRATGDFGFGPVVFVLTTIAWREAWKYRDRAYRYCLLDMGHAWQSLVMSAGAMGCGSLATGHFADDKVARLCGLNEDEWPMLVVRLSGEPIPVRDPGAGERVWLGGIANRLSDQQIAYPRIDRMHAATKMALGLPEETGSDGMHPPIPDCSVRSFGEVARGRRSALDFVGGTRSMPLADLVAILAFASEPTPSDFAAGRFIQLYLYVHRVDGLEPGVYRYSPEGGLELVKPGDQRVAAAGLSLRQDLAGNACVALSMVADLEGVALLHGDRGYRYAYFEAGAIGHRLYLGAESLGLGATGIGAFFDDEVHSYLDLGSGQVVYHFAIGYPVFDPRLEA
jgi:SagB-type dehydrogenase family enzyme